jgi:CDP-diacylglycerol--glycerol-3-phosphate 3-phosphatidyltransferase
MERFWTIPNILSILRIILIIPIVGQLKLNTSQSNFLAFILIAVAYITDFLDGLIARKFKMTSNIGKILDPIGDKLLAITVAGVLYFSKRIPLYFFLLIFARDLIISLGAMYAINLKGRILLPIFAGKLTTAVLGIVLSLYPLRYSNVIQSQILKQSIEAITNFGTIISSLLLVLSGIAYAVYYYRHFLETRNP